MIDDSNRACLGPKDSSVHHGCIEKREESSIAQDLNLTIPQPSYANIGGKSDGYEEESVIDILEVNR